MKILTNFNKCTICLEKAELTFEHIIPSSLGGFIEANIQCSKCNNDVLGSKLISKAKKILPIRLAIRALKKDLPSLFDSIEEGQEYSTQMSDNSSNVAFYKKGKIKSKSYKSEDGIINVDKYDSEKHIRNILSKNGSSIDEINKKISEFNKLEVDKQLTIYKSINIIKRTFKFLFPRAGVFEMDNRIIALIAYNYLCIIIGETIFDDSFNCIRSFIHKETNSKHIDIEQIPYTGPYKSYHKLYLEIQEDKTQITIVLFGSIIYIITFNHIKITTNKNHVIIQDLVDKNIYYSETIKDAEEGKYYMI